MATVLIVDDSRTSRRILRTILEKEGYQVIGEASNGEEGFNMYKSTKPDFVTMDITMPVMDGLECLTLIMHENPDAKVIMVTAAGQKNNMIQAVKIGACDFIQKPFDEEQILTIFKNL